MELKINKTVNVESMFEEFRHLHYTRKLDYFHSHFGIIPFSFPKIDSSLSWFYKENCLNTLVHNFYEEVKNKNLYDLSFKKDESVMIFDIKPKSQSQRIHYNTFLLSVFSSEQYVTSFNLPETESENIENVASIVNLRYRKVQSAVTEIKNHLKFKDAKTDLRYQFVRVFYSGFQSVGSSSEINLHIRHKFVELYLYSYGSAVANYINSLRRFLMKIDSDFFL